MKQIRRRGAAVLAFVILLMTSSFAPAASFAANGTEWKVEGSVDGDEVKLSFSYEGLAAEFTGFNLEMTVPPELDQGSAVFSSDNDKIAGAALGNYDNRVNRYKLLVLSPSLTASPQGKQGKIGDLTFKYRPGAVKGPLPITLNLVKIYGYGHNEPIVAAQDFVLELDGTEVDKEPPAPVTGIELVRATTNSVSIRWQANSESDLDGYNIYVDGTFKEKVTLPAYSMTGLNQNTEYLIEVEAVDKTGNKAIKVPMTVRTLEEVKQPPAPVTGIELVRATTNSVSIRWQANSEPDLDGYNIYVDGTFKEKVALPAYSMTGLNPNTEYLIEVEAVDKTGNKAIKVPMTVQTLKQQDPGPEPTDGLITIHHDGIIGIGEETSVTLSVKAEDLYAFDISFAYDPDLLDLTDIDTHPEFGLDGGFIVSDEFGNIRILNTLLERKDGITGNIDLLTFTFKAKHVEARGSLTVLQRSKLTDSKMNLSVLEEDIFRYIAVANPDLNGNGVGVDDLTLVAKAFGADTSSPLYEARLDMNKDGRIDIVDIAYIAYRLLSQ